MLWFSFTYLFSVIRSDNVSYERNLTVNVYSNFMSLQLKRWTLKDVKYNLSYKNLDFSQLA